MLVTSREDSNKRWLYICVDGDLYRTVAAQGFRKELNLPKEFLTKKQVDEWFCDLEYRCARNYAFRLLSKCHYPTHILETKLRMRRISKTVIERVLKDCIKYGFIKNSLWLEKFIEREFAKGWGPKAIHLKLKAKGFDAKEFVDLLNTVIPRYLEKEKARQLLDKKANLTRGKQFSLLQRKGYSQDIIYDVVTGDS